MEDERESHRIQYELADVGLSAFACMFFQDPSMLAFQKRMQDKKELSIPYAKMFLSLYFSGDGRDRVFIIE